MKFEYDPDKSSANKTKHGIDFEEVQKLWLGEVVELSAKDKKEPRSLIIGKTGGVYWSVIVTRRGANLRIISARRSRDEEKQIYKRA